VASCALTVPLSWIIDQWQARHGSHLFPGPAELDEYEDLKVAELQRQVSMAVSGLVPEMIAIAVDNDITLPGTNPLSPVAGEEDSAGISVLIRDYGREVAVAILAAVSLLLAGTMLKKGGAAAVTVGSTPTAPELGSEQLETGGIDPVLSEATDVRERVQALVRNDPAQAAALVQRWLNAA
jgi:flagellar biosynthesis/type III secretory pathway M-ring protein FliF/YscJ